MPVLIDGSLMVWNVLSMELLMMLAEKYSIYISPQECLEGYFELTKGFISQYGIPLAVYVDRHTIFRSPLEGKLSLEEELSGKRVNETQFGRDSLSGY
jgi:hypothetical protein